VVWESSRRCLATRAEKVTDFNGTAHHDYDYDVSLTLDELGRIIGVHGNEAIKSNRNDAGSLQKHLRAIQRLSSDCELLPNLS
jgi:hypothetical protein